MKAIHVKRLIGNISQKYSLHAAKQPGPKRLDYLELYQDIRTPGPSIDVEVFTIPGEGLFAAFANSGRKRQDISGLYKWTDRSFAMYQRLQTNMAQAWEFFSISGSVSGNVFTFLKELCNGGKITSAGRQAYLSTYLF